MQSIFAVLLLSATVYSVPVADQFGYAVSDPKTGDHKSAQEIRNGDSVAGQYKTLDADGLMRTVNYRADPLHGFRAEVDRSPAAATAVITAAENPLIAKSLIGPTAALTIARSAPSPILSTLDLMPALAAMDPISADRLNVRSSLLPTSSSAVSMKFDTRRADTVMSSSAPAVSRVWQETVPAAAVAVVPQIQAIDWATPIIKK